MNSGKTIFKQLLQFFPRYEFYKCIARYKGHYKVRKFSCFDQFLCLMYAQISGRESLREIETCLNSHHEKLYHIGFSGRVSKSTIAPANESRDYRIFNDFGSVLIGIAQELYKNDAFAIDLQQPVFAFDSTTIDLCLSLFPWAEFYLAEGRSQGAYALGLARFHTGFCHYYNKQDS